MQTSLNDDPRIPGDITDEPSAEYNAAMSRFVSSVCGEISDLTIEEDLLSKFFTWQAGQNNTVSERLFRRKYRPVIRWWILPEYVWYPCLLP